MAWHNIKAAFTRIVLIVGIAGSIAVGSVGLMGTSDVAAMPSSCDRMYASAEYYWELYKFWYAFGYFDLANHYRGVSDYIYWTANELCN